MSSNKFGAIERLTPKQAAFVSEYLKNGGNATEAYKKAGYNVTTDNSAAVNAARLLRTSKITRAIAKRQAERNERMQLEEDFELKKAIDILEKCSEPQQVYNFDGKPKKDKAGHAVFMFDICEDETYEVIKNGQWLSDEEYGVIHRVASDGKIKGVLNKAVDFCSAKKAHLRIDTHKDNKIMQHQIEKNGFKKCGIIKLINGDERIAYEKI